MRRLRRIFPYILAVNILRSGDQKRRDTITANGVEGGGGRALSLLIVSPPPRPSINPCGMRRKGGGGSGQTHTMPSPPLTSLLFDPYRGTPPSSSGTAFAEWRRFALWSSCAKTPRLANPRPTYDREGGEEEVQWVRREGEEKIGPTNLATARSGAIGEGGPERDSIMTTGGEKGRRAPNGISRKIDTELSRTVLVDPYYFA